MKRDLYVEVSARLIADLGKGAVSWVRPNTPSSVSCSASAVAPRRLHRFRR